MVLSFEGALRMAGLRPLDEADAVFWGLRRVVGAPKSLSRPR